MCKNEQDIILSIRLLRLLDCLEGLFMIACYHRLKKRLVRLAAALDVQLLEEGAAGATGHARPKHIRNREVDFGGDGEVRRGADLTAMVAQVAAHHDECVRVRCRTSESGKVTDSVARCIEQIKRTVAEEVKSLKGARLERWVLLREVDLA